MQKHAVRVCGQGQEGNKKSVLDYVITTKEDAIHFNEMLIDEERVITPYRVEKTDGMVRIKYTDHHMIRCKINWSTMGRESEPKKKRLDPNRYNEFAEELARNNVSQMIDETKFSESYEKWSRKVMEISEKCSKEVKPRKCWKSNRLLKKAKQKVVKRLRQPRLRAETIKILKFRKKLIMEYINEEYEKRNEQKVMNIVEDVKRAGGVDSKTFWDVKRRLIGAPKESSCAIMDENGVKQEDEDKVKEVYREYFSQLLQANKGSTEEEMKTEESVRYAMCALEKLSKKTKPNLTQEEEVKDVVHQLDIKKAKDSMNWNNQIIVHGGEEIIKSLVQIFQIIDKKMEIPVEWEKMLIKTINKKGQSLLMSNKRGLFLTNNASKVYERVIKKRNDTGVSQGSSQWQMGGMKKRSTVDNLFIMYSVIERNK